jgi:hypothetical protein
MYIYMAAVVWRFFFFFFFFFCFCFFKAVGTVGRHFLTGLDWH